MEKNTELDKLIWQINNSFDRGKTHKNNCALLNGGPCPLIMSAINSMREKQLKG